MKTTTTFILCILIFIGCNKKHEDKAEGKNYLLMVKVDTIYKCIGAVHFIGQEGNTTVRYYDTSYSVDSIWISNSGKILIDKTTKNNQ